MKMLLHSFKLLVVSVLLILYTYCFGITSIENFIKYGYFGTNCLIVAKNEEEIQDIPQPGDLPFLQHENLTNMLFCSYCHNANI